MSADFPHLQGAYRANALLSDHERIAWIRQERWIQYARAERILHRLADLVDYPPRDRMPCLVIYGATGMGKTRIIQKFLRDNRSRFDAKLGKTRLPVVYIPDAASTKRTGPVRGTARRLGWRLLPRHQRYDAAAPNSGFSPANGRAYACDR